MRRDLGFSGLLERTASLLFHNKSGGNNVRSDCKYVVGAASWPAIMKMEVNDPWVLAVISNAIVAHRLDSNLMKSKSRAEFFSQLILLD